MIFFPKNSFQELVSRTFERTLPTLQYCIWNPLTYWARKSGWTEQEKLYHNFFRGDYMIWHSYTQSMHPLAYLERQRADAFFRRVETFLPGIEIPDWAQHTRRAVDFDYEGMLNPYRALDIVEQEATPKPHYGYGYPSSITHIGNYRFVLGYWAQRLFFNEKIKGTVMTGIFDETHKKVIDSWYAESEGNEILKLKKMTPKERAEKRQQAKKWMKNIDTFYPEYKNYKIPKQVRIQEPYYTRTCELIINHVFIQQWMGVLKKNVFTSDELQGIYEFFINQRDDVFFQMNEVDGLYQATPLYTKFVKELKVPNIFELEKYTAKVIEHQYIDKWQANYGITAKTVANFEYVQRKFNSQVQNKTARLYISEEIYNPLFKQKLADHVKDSSIKGSLVAHFFNKEGEKSLETFEALHKETQDELHFISRESMEHFFLRVRNIVKTFPFKPQAVPEVKF